MTESGNKNQTPSATEPTSNQRLVSAHMKRSREMARDGLFKEAAILWQQANRLSPTPLDPAPLLTWLVNSQQMGPATQLFFAHHRLLEKQHPDLHQNFSALLAANLLIGSPEVAQNIPPKEKILQELKPAKAALRAFCKNRPDQLEKSGSKLPDNSPFKAFTSILKGLAISTQEPAQILQQIQSIPANSPFASLARIAGIRTLTGAPLVRALMQVPEADQQLLARMMGIEADLLVLLNQLTKATRSRQRLNALLDYPKELPGPWIRSCLLDLLVDNLAKRSEVEARFGPFSELETARLLALHHQAKKHRVRTNSYWKQVLKRIKEEPDTPLQSLYVSQIHKQFAALEESAPWPSRRHIIDHLQEALEHDPDDSQTVLQLLHWHSQDEDQSGYHRLVSQAEQRFPDEPEILRVAAEAALSRKSYKKATTLAKKVLRLAPEERHISTLLINALLQQARNQIKAGRLSLAEKGLKSALKHSTDKRLNSQIHTLQALLEYQRGDYESENHFLQQGETLAKGSPSFPLFLLFEAGQMGIAKSRIYDYLQRLDQSTKTPQSKIETKEILSLIRHHHDLKNPLVPEVFDRLNNYLEQASRLDFSKQEQLDLCEDLFHVKHFLLLNKYARVGQKRWASEPAFLFFQLYGESLGETHRISDEGYFALREALPTVARRGDNQTARRIDCLMGHSPSGSRRNLGARSPAKIPKLLERQLVKSLKKLIESEFGQSRQSLSESGLRRLLLEQLAESEYASRGPFILSYLIDKATDREEGPTSRPKKKNPPPMRQLEMDLFE
ncbi:MAG: hypothetical protein HQL67_00245 [Magnetococcales bacterium]|nr:hypothetical protein [Magnetococcales bacterium]